MCASQYHVHTGHVRQRQSVYTPTKNQVTGLYGINKSPYNISVNLDAYHPYIFVPSLHNANTNVLPVPPACGPSCLPPCPAPSPGEPLTYR